MCFASIDFTVITHVANVVVALSAVAGVVIAFLGLQTWRCELHGRADFDLARRVMFAVYELRNAIRQSRNELSFGFPDSQYDRVNKKASDLDVALLEAEVLWGASLHAPKLSMNRCLSTLWKMRRRQIDAQRKELKLTDKDHEEIEAVLSGYGEENDEFGKSVDDAVSAFENVLRPNLLRRK
jgi:hypothetical protein